MNLNHPAVIDLVDANGSFLDYISGMKLRIELRTLGRMIEAKLIGVEQFFPKDGDSPDHASGEFTGYSDTKEGAIKELAKSCSGANWCEDSEKRFLSYFRSPLGKGGVFPLFTLNEI